MNYWEELKKRLEAEDEFEGKLDLLRIFPRTQIRSLRDKDLAGRIPLLSLFEELTSLAEAVLRGSYEISLSRILLKDQEPPGPFAIVAMGKFGGREMTYLSDLDILYLYEREQDQELYSRLGQRILSALTLITREGFAYRIDTALRPSGNSGTLVSRLTTFREYHREIGRTWERQALIKGRAVLGDSTFLEEIEETFSSISYQTYSPLQIAEEMAKLRTRMERELARERPGMYNLKTGRGGLVDIEFAVQYLQLLHGKDRPSLRTPNTIEALRSLCKESLLERKEARMLEEAYLFYREIETRLRLLLERPADELSEGAEWMRELEGKFFKGRSLLPNYLKRREKVRALYKKVLQI